jgi:hypothetical protein
MTPQSLHNAESWELLSAGLTFPGKLGNNISIYRPCLRRISAHVHMFFEIRTLTLIYRRLSTLKSVIPQAEAIYMQATKRRIESESCFEIEQQGHCRFRILVSTISTPKVTSTNDRTIQLITRGAKSDLIGPVYASKFQFTTLSKLLFDYQRWRQCFKL